MALAFSIVQNGAGLTFDIFIRSISFPFTCFMA